MVRKKVIKKKSHKEATGIYVCVVAGLIIVLCGILSYSSVKEYDKEIQKLQEVISSKKQKIESAAKIKSKLLLVSRLVGWRDEIAWRKVKGGWTNQDKLRAYLNDWTNHLKEVHGIKKYELWPDGAASDLEKHMTIDKLMVEMEQIIKNNKMKETSASSERDSARKEKLKALGDIIQLRDNKNNEIISLRKSVETIEKRVKSIIEQGEANVRSIAEEIKSKSRNIVSTTRESEEKLIEITKELNEYKDRLVKLKKKLRIAKEGFEVDGEVIVSDFANGYVYLDLGRDDAVFEGMEFDVFSIKKGGVRLKKGKVTIRKLYDTYSEAVVLEGTMDLRSPILVGDLVNSQLYSRNKAKAFSFAGKLIGRFTEEDLKQKIQEFGGVILDDITTAINYLIVGDGYESDPVFEKSKHFGAVIIREKELYGLLGIKW